MATQKQVKAALADIPAGTQVTIRRTDGTEIVGQIGEQADDGSVRLQDRGEAVPASELDDILLDVIIGGDPE